MAHFERIEFPEINRIAIYVIDDYGNKAELSPRQAVDLLHWLEIQRLTEDEGKTMQTEGMTKEQAELLAIVIRKQGLTWLNDETSNAYLRTEVFGGLKQKVKVVPAEFGSGCEVHVSWEQRDHFFKNRQHWEAFVKEIEDDVKAAAGDGSTPVGEEGEVDQGHESE